MNDKPIQVGDLVMVIRPSRLHVCGVRNAGKRGPSIFRVADISTSASRCSVCGEELPPEQHAWVEGEYAVVPLYRLKRLPPLSELEGQRTQEDMREPA